MGLFSKTKRNEQPSVSQADTSYVYAPGAQVMVNILVMPDGTIAPRTKENYAKLTRYIKRHFKTKNIYDKRTKAWRYLVNHDSEAKREATT